MASIADVQTELHAVDKRLVAVETKMDLGFEQLNERLDKFSDQGKAPVAKSGVWALPSPGSIVEYAKAIGLLAGVLTGVWGVAYSGAQSGGNTGATTAVEDAVEQGEAVPMAAPVVRVVPVPVPTPVIVEPPVAAPPVSDDLMELP